MEDEKLEELTAEERQVLHEIAALVERAIETHSLACRCFICWNFASGKNAEDGFMRACNAVLFEGENVGTKAVQRWS